MSAFRSIRQVVATSSRVSARTAVASSCRSRLLLTAATRLAAPSTRAFSVSARSLGEAASDVALSQKLQEELKYEQEVAAQEEPEFLTTFKSQNIWQIEDVAGNDEVTLTRKFGNETIRLVFSIADIQSPQENEFDEQEEEGESEDSEDAAVNSYPLRCSFSITKSAGPGALNIDAMCQDGTFIVDNLSFYSDTKIGTELTAEMDWKRRGLYIGPQFETLDVAVQEAFEQFLQERGINENLALFIPEYAEHKEQKEYVKWLENVKSFVEL
ncbi:mitochondrial glyco protein [Neolentinus lepideus HHB14362 ss-1]|uniref:Mitochondrial glyco protein n=1 Tax=Neolentinus lepideus HHB14362 ss-1 TaxID=1314782 RepID=A0A165S9Z5_9AGAM|nr:mitochondrial glyco protein [Neolentinus lepideus HHB14362 ss-1]